jgi:hypothetical protein
MKKTFLTVCIAAMAAVSANAQLYVGGQLGFDTKKVTNPVSTDTTKMTQFIFGPEVGYSLNEKWDVGVNLNFKIGSNKNYPNKETALGYSFAPYVRYTFAQFGDFKVLAKGSLFISGENITSEYLSTPNSKVKASASEFGATIYPMLAYSISEHFCLLTDLNFLGLNFVSGSTKQTAGANTVTTSKYTAFGLNVNSDNAFSLGALRVGFVYVF